MSGKTSGKGTGVPPLVLVDGSSYLYRAYHALPPLTNAKGEPTGAIKGVISMLRRLLKDYPDSPVAVVFDAKGKTFRDELFAQYKAQRPPMPDDLQPQVEPIKQLVSAMGLPLLVEDGVEADDVIGTLARQASEQSRALVVSTGDKDMAQLVNDHVSLVNTMTGTALDEAGVQEKYGFAPPLMIDYLALMGDKSDNIPGVPGVGDKTARALVQALGGLDDIYEDLEAVRALDFRGAKKMPEKLAEHKEQAYLSRELATIKTDLALDLRPEDIHPGRPDKAQLLRLFRQLDFRAWVAELEEDPSAGQPQEPAEQAPAPLDTDYETLTDWSGFDAWFKTLEQAEVFALDTETTSLHAMEAKLVGLSFAVEPGKAAYLPLGHDYMGAPEQLEYDPVLERLKPLLESKKHGKLGQNLKYDLNVLRNHDIELAGIRYDTMLESYVLNATASRHDMDSLALKHLDHRCTSFEEIAGKGSKQLTFNQIALESAAPYAAEDADITLRLHRHFWPQLSGDEPLKRVFTDLEMPLLTVLANIERKGALVSGKRLGEQSRELGKRLEELEREAHDIAGKPFNLGSTQQLGAILFEEQKLPVIKKTPKGAPSTAEAVLQELALDYPLPRVLMEYRGLSKLKSTYTDKLPQMINPVTGRIHTSYHQAITATGRLSSSDPNLQNIPIRSEQGRRIRQAFIAPKGYKLLAADYSQIELRIMAHLSEDAGLLKAFEQGQDVHKATAAEVFGVALDGVTPEMRRRAKAINFGLIYGMSAFGLAKQLQLGRNEAQAYIDRYFERYPGVQTYMDRIRTSAREQGYVETLMGRRLYLPEINARNHNQRQGAERTAINAPMQGTAADIIKIAMIDVDRWLAGSDLDAGIIMQVHDELVLEVAEKHLDAVARGVSERMARAAELRVPLVVDVGSGDNWDQAH